MVIISKMVTVRKNIIIAIKYEVTYGLLISIFRFDLGSFERSSWPWEGCHHIFWVSCLCVQEQTCTAIEWQKFNYCSICYFIILPCVYLNLYAVHNIAMEL